MQGEGGGGVSTPLDLRMQLLCFVSCDSISMPLSISVLCVFQERKLEDRRKRFKEDRDKFEDEQDVGRLQHMFSCMSVRFGLSSINSS